MNQVEDVVETIMSQGEVEQPRITTGVHGLDTVLNGGFLPGHTFLLLGAPGTGKTILANQICTYQARQRYGSVYVTLLSESHTRMVSNLKKLSFFDESIVAKTLHYISGYQVLEEQGFDGLRQLIHQLVKGKKARVLVIEGYNILESMAGEVLAYRKFFHELQFLATLSGCVVLLVNNGPVEKPSASNALVDGILELQSNLSNVRETRQLRLLKFRGSAHLQGYHAFEINDDGVTIFPRREALTFTGDNLASDLSRLAFGIPDFDAMLGGGVLSKSTTFLTGAAGTGKTQLGMSFLLAGAEADERGLFFGFNEAPARLMTNEGAIAARLKAHERTGQIGFHWQQPAEMQLDAFAESLLLAIQNKQYKRLFIDGIEGLELSSDSQDRLKTFLPFFLNELRNLSVTPILSLLVPGIFSTALQPSIENFLQYADNIVLMRHIDSQHQLKNELAIVKLAGNHDHHWHRFEITTQGFQVEPANEGST